MVIKVERFFGHTVSVGWELCRIHIVLAHALLSAGLTGAVSLHSKLQAQVPSMPSKTAIFFSSQTSLAVMDCFSCSIGLSNLPPCLPNRFIFPKYQSSLTCILTMCQVSHRCSAAHNSFSWIFGFVSAASPALLCLDV